MLTRGEVTTLDASPGTTPINDTAAKSRTMPTTASRCVLAAAESTAVITTDFAGDDAEAEEDEEEREETFILTRRR